MGEDGVGAFRVANTVTLVLTHSTSGKILVQTGAATNDNSNPGSQSAFRQLPWLRCRHDENPFLGARRIIRKQLEIDELEVQLSQDVQILQHEKLLDLYPGLTT